MIAREPVLAPPGERAGEHRVTGALHQRDEEMYIVQREKAQAVHLVRDEQP